MQLRKFVISIVTKYSGDGFKEADRDADRLKRSSERAATATDGLQRSTTSAGRAASKAAAAERQLAAETERAAKASKRAAEARAREAARTEQDFLRAVETAEKALDREEALATRRQAAEAKDAAKREQARAREAARTEADFLKAVESAEKAIDREESASARQEAANRRSEERAAAAQAKAAQRAAAAQERTSAKEAATERRSLDKLRKDRERAENENRRHAEQVTKARQRDHQKMLDDDAHAYLERKRRRLDDLRDEEETRNRRREILKGTASDIGGIAATAGRVLTVGAVGVAALGTAVLTTGVSFESLRARLKTVEGSADGAAQAFATIKEFAKTTPYELDEVTTAYVRLKGLGLDASTESLRSFGNIAAAQGRSIIDFIEAVADASTGEFERLKEFGVRASSQGDKVAFTFAGVTTTVGKNAEEIQAYLKNLSDANFGTAMADQSATATGMLSNLSDTLTTFLDTVAQMGVLDAFKALLGDIAARFGESDGFARILADTLITVIETIREWVASISDDDIEGALTALYEAVVGVASAVVKLVEAFNWFVDKSGGMENALTNLTVLVFGLAAAFNGPVGLVVAAGAAGFAFSQFVATALFGLDELDAQIAASDARIKELEASLRGYEERATNMLNDIEARERDLENKQKERDKEDAKKVKKAVGGLGAGLLGEKDAAEQAFRLRQLTSGNEAQQKQGREKLLTAEGRVVFDAVGQAEKRRVQEAEATARKQAAKRGQDADAAAAAARAAVEEGNAATRQKAFEAATATFAATGSAEAAAAAAVAKVGQVKGAAKGKKGKGDQFFEFEEDIKRAAKQQAEEFAQRELERLIATGTDPDEAIALARQAGRERAKELEEKFRKAGKVFDASSKNILDILGLRGPGSVLENRPPPQTLLITIAPIIKLIENLTITVQGAGSDKERDQLQDAANQARDAMLAKLEDLPALVAQMFELQGKRLLAASGETIPGVQ